MEVPSRKYHDIVITTTNDHVTINVDEAACKLNCVINDTFKTACPGSPTSPTKMCLTSMADPRGTNMKYPGRESSVRHHIMRGRTTESDPEW